MGNTSAWRTWSSTITVHPHACGEYLTHLRRILAVAGSPPRVWGIREAPTCRSRLGRFTPTRVGNTASERGRHSPRHRFTPTRVGNTRAAERLTAAPRGSPPRVWGILILLRLAHGHGRFTPTRVGNTPSNRRSMPGLAGSPPRVWGIRAHAVRRRGRRSGSPPRVWGILLPPNHRPPLCSVHPHACGEYVRRRADVHRYEGSPPRVWGILAMQIGHQRDYRVHPHACGEYSRPARASMCNTGSPPRVWGIPPGSPINIRFRRFTPTRVGNTCRQCRGSCRNPVHPHACGEYLPALGLDGRGVGSPPRVWGILPQRVVGHPRRRFTPTRVGNTSVNGCCSTLYAGSPPRVWGILIVSQRLALL